MTGTPPRATIREVSPPPAAPPPPPDRRPGRPTASGATATIPRPGRPAAGTRPTVPRPAGSVLRQEQASFGYAFQGLVHAWRTQRHLRIHVSLAIFAIGLGLTFTITAAEWAALLTVITLVLALELLNTVIESVVDLVTHEFHPNAKIAKDVAAGTVLLASAGALAVGIAIFLPRIIALATGLLLR